MNCSRCGASQGPLSRYCAKCGAAIDLTSAPPARLVGRDLGRDQVIRYPADWMAQAEADFGWDRESLLVEFFVLECLMFDYAAVRVWGGDSPHRSALVEGFLESIGETAGHAMLDAFSRRAASYATALNGPKPFEAIGRICAGFVGHPTDAALVGLASRLSFEQAASTANFLRSLNFAK